MNTPIYTTTKIFLFAALIAALFGPLCVDASAGWEEETMLVSLKGDQTIVQGVKNKDVLFSDKDPQEAFVWAMNKGMITVIRPGHYVVSKSIEIPRDAITLIVEEGAKIEMDKESKQATGVAFHYGASKRLAQYLMPIIHVKCRNNVRILFFGKLIGKGFAKSELRPYPCQTIGITYDGRDGGNIGVNGGYLLQGGHTVDFIDTRGVQVPIAVSGAGTMIGLEGSDDIHIGMVANLVPENVKDTGQQVDRRGWPFDTPPPKAFRRTGECVDLNSANSNIFVDLLIAENGHELVDANGSSIEVKELISLGESAKLMCFTFGAGTRCSDRHGKVPADHLSIGRAVQYEHVSSVKRIMQVPKFPEAFPKFDVTAAIEVTLGDGSKKTFSKTVTIDVEKPVDYPVPEKEKGKAAK
jgi:hypothetical protein